MHDSLVELEIWRDSTTDCGVSCPRIRTLVAMATYSSNRVIIGKMVLPLFSAVFHPILFILAGNNNMHDSLVEFEIWRDSTTDCGVSCPLASEKIPIDR